MKRIRISLWALVCLALFLGGWTAYRESIARLTFGTASGTTLTATTGTITTLDATDATIANAAITAETVTRSVQTESVLTSVSLGGTTLTPIAAEYNYLDCTPGTAAVNKTVVPTWPGKTFTGLTLTSTTIGTYMMNPHSVDLAKIYKATGTVENGHTSKTITVTGVLPSSVPISAVKCEDTTNAVHIEGVTVTTNSINVILSGDPGSTNCDVAALIYQ